MLRGALLVYRGNECLAYPSRFDICTTLYESDKSCELSHVVNQTYGIGFYL